MSSDKEKQDTEATSVSQLDLSEMGEPVACKGRRTPIPHGNLRGHSMSNSKKPTCQQTDCIFKSPQMRRTLYSGSTDSLTKIPKKMSGTVKEEVPRRSLSNSNIQRNSHIEREFKKLLQEQSQLRKDLSAKEGEVIKLDGRIQMLLRDKSRLQSLLATNDKELKQVKRSNEILKMKVGTLEGCMMKKDDKIKHELAAVKCRMVARDHEMFDLQAELADIKKALAKKDRLIASLKKSSSNPVTSLQEGDLDTTVQPELIASSCEVDVETGGSRDAAEGSESEALQEQELLLQEEVNKRVNAYLAENATNADECNKHLIAYKNSLEDRIRDLKEVIVQKEEKLAEAEIHTRDVMQQMKHFQQELERKEMDFEEVFNHSLALQNTLDQYETDAAAKEELVQKLEHEIALHQKEAEEFRAKIEEQEDVIVNIRNMHKAYVQEVQKAESERQAALKTQALEMKGIVQQLQDILHKYSALQEEISVLRDENKTISDEAERMRSKLQQANEGKDALLTELDQMRQETEDIKARFAASEELVEQMDKMLKEFPEQLMQEKQENETRMVFRYRHLEESLVAGLKHVKVAVQAQKDAFLTVMKDAHDKLTFMESDLARFKNEQVSQLQVLQAELRALLEDKSQLEAEREKYAGAAQEEIDKWKKLYLDLWAKVEPFQDQLDAYEREKNLLLGQSTEVRDALDKLSERYACLLGHQNHKQKIHHINKLKSDIAQLRQEVFKLREVNQKQQSLIHKLQQQGSSLHLTPGRRPCLQNTGNKENQHPFQR